MITIKVWTITKLIITHACVGPAFCTHNLNAYKTSFIKLEKTLAVF